jgi:squalene-associated FAD-dependent desaturase
VGGGLAGLAAAVRLAEAGAAVTLLEARPRLGGATSSFQRGSLTVDTGQHVLLRCYEQYLDFLRRVGTADGVAMQDRFDVSVLHSDGRRATLRRGGLPAPLHLSGALLRYGLLSQRERNKVLGAALRLRAMDPDDPALDATSFGDWLAAHGQGRNAVDVLWGMFTVAALNTDVDTASLALAAKVFKVGLLTHRDAADIGVPRLPLSRLHGDAAATRLADLGADVRTGVRVSALRCDDRHATVVTPEGEITADLVVLAVPHQDAARLVPDDAVPGGTATWSGLGASPIVNLHVRYDGRVIDEPFVAVVGSPVQWVFDRTDVAGAADGSGGQYLAVSLSDAASLVDTPVADLRREFLPELARLFPAANERRVEEFFVTRERRATFLQAPGSKALRPAATTRVSTLVLAGAWTDTGWPDTMEGAVRSGYHAARVGTLHLMEASSDRTRVGAA